jgi:WD40 repeat protein
MSGNHDEGAGDRLADRLAAFDDRLAAGEAKRPDELQPDVDPELLPEWKRLTAVLTLLEQAWPRKGADAREEERATAVSHSGPSEAEASWPEGEPSGKLGRFEIVRTLGQGGFGVVFLARDPLLRRLVALKVPQPETLLTPDARKRFLREAQAAAGLDHPNIVPVYETGTIGTVTYIAAAYCPGPTLAEWLAQQTRPVPPHDAARLIATLARAVEHAHERGVLHRDLKPSNVLLVRPAPGGDAEPPDDRLGNFQARITDFSLAKVADGLGPETRSGVPFGSPPYMAPEQAEGRLRAIGPQADLYALGAILYELLTGRAPFVGESQLDTLRQVIVDDPIPPRRVRREIPRALEAITLRCLEKDPGRRFQSARGLAEDLERFLSGEPTRTRPPASWERALRGARRHPAAVTVVVVATILAVAAWGAARSYEARLGRFQRIAELRRDDATESNRRARQLQYVGDIRQAANLLRDCKVTHALTLLERLRPGQRDEDLRDFAWHYLHRLATVDTARLVLAGHVGEVYHAEFFPDGKTVASSGQDGTLRLWDSRSGQLKRAIQAHASEANWVAVSPDGEMLASAGDDGMVTLWDVAAGRRHRPPSLPHKRPVVIARFTPDGRSLVTCTRGDSGILVWDLKAAKVRLTIKAEATDVENMAISPDGKLLATVGSGGGFPPTGFANLWDLGTGTRAANLVRQSGRIDAVAFSHDGTRVVTGSHDLAVRLWEVPSGKPLDSFLGHESGVYTVGFAAGDSTIVSAGDDETIRFWDAATGAVRGAHRGHASRVWGLAVSRDGRAIASASRDGTVRLWDARPPRPFVTVPVSGPVVGLEFAGDSRSVTIMDHSWELSTWDVESGAPIRRGRINAKPDGLLPPCLANVAVFSPDCRTLLAGTTAPVPTVWDLPSCKLRHLITDARFWVVQADIAPDGQSAVLLCTGPQNQGPTEVWFWDPQHVRKLEISGCRLLACDWSTHLLAVQGEDLTLRELPGGSILSRVASPDTYSLAFSHDGRLLAAGLLNGRTHILDVPSLLLIKELKGHCGGRPAVAFAPDGRTLATASAPHFPTLWDVATGEVLLTLEGEAEGRGFLHFAPDGRALAWAGTNGVYLWRNSKPSNGKRSLSGGTAPVR